VFWREVPHAPADREEFLGRQKGSLNRLVVLPVEGLDDHWVVRRYAEIE